MTNTQKPEKAHHMKKSEEEATLHVLKTLKTTLKTSQNFQNVDSFETPYQKSHNRNLLKPTTGIHPNKIPHNIHRLPSPET